MNILVLTNKSVESLACDGKSLHVFYLLRRNMLGRICVQPCGVSKLNSDVARTEIKGCHPGIAAKVFVWLHFALQKLANWYAA